MTGKPLKNIVSWVFPHDKPYIRHEPQAEYTSQHTKPEIIKYIGWVHIAHWYLMCTSVFNRIQHQMTDYFVWR